MEEKIFLSLFQVHTILITNPAASINWARYPHPILRMPLRGVKSSVGVDAAMPDPEGAFHIRGGQLRRMIRRPAHRPSEMRGVRGGAIVVGSGEAHSVLAPRVAHQLVLLNEGATAGTADEGPLPRVDALVLGAVVFALKPAPAEGAAVRPQGSHHRRVEREVG